MFTILEKKTLEKQLKNLPKEIRERYQVWKEVAALQGLSGLKQMKGLHDEGLKGKWTGYRSSRLNKKWRVIYKADKKCFEIYVIEISPHNY